MSWPAGLPLGSVNFGKAAVMQSGDNLPMRVTVDVMLASDAQSKVLVYRPTGSPLPGVTTLFATDEGTDEHTLALPLCDTPNMGYGNGTGIVLDPEHLYTHVYQAKIEYLSPNLATVYTALTATKRFVLTQAAPDGDVDDMLLIPSSGASFGVPVSIPDQWSEDIESAEAAAWQAQQAAAAAQQAVQDSTAFVETAVEAAIDTPGSGIETRLKATIGGAVEPAIAAEVARADGTYATPTDVSDAVAAEDIPGQVAAAVAADPAVAAAAEAAVGDAVDGRALTQVVDFGINTATARPAGVAPVMWLGWGIPTAARSYDLVIQRTAMPVPNMYYDGTSVVTA